MSSLIPKDAGVFDPARRFAFTNITEEDLLSAWGGNPITVKAGQTVELPHHLANKLTDELVDRIMIEGTKQEEAAVGTPYYRSPSANQLGIPAARKVWEDQIVRELEVDEESPEMQVIRADIKAQLMADMERGDAGSVSDIKLDPTEFAELGDSNAAAGIPARQPLVVPAIDPTATKSTGKQPRKAK